VRSDPAALLWHPQARIASSPILAIAQRTAWEKIEAVI
jgi:hypothetical protein